MAAKTKKVILFIVEGPTDENALSPVLKKIFHNEEVRFHVVHGDVTSEWLVNSTNAIKTVNEHIKAEMDRYGFRRNDIIKVIHLVDTDGAFISNGCVVAGDIEKLCYEENQIISPNPQGTTERNSKKAQVLSRLYSTAAIGTTPYSVYYFSRNMEHVMHNINPPCCFLRQSAHRADRFNRSKEKRPGQDVGALLSFEENTLQSLAPLF